MVKAETDPGAGSVTGQVVQDKPFFTTDIELALETRDGSTARTIRISEASSPFEFTGVSAPKQIVIDPGYHALRRLDPTEIPPTVNSLKSSSATALVVCSQASTSGPRLADVILRSLGIRHYTIMDEDDLGPGRLDDRDVILVGLPRDQGLLRTAPNGLILNERGFALDGSTTPADADTFFGVMAHPGDPLRVLAVFLPGPPAAAEIAAAKITHYGRYSYVTFKDGQNRDKGSWAVTHSPVLHRWD
jgi:hypothetical protein